MEVLLFELERKFQSQPYLEALYKAMFILAYYGLMRVGEIAYTANENCHTIRACDVHIGRNKNKILIMLYSSKTHDNESEPQKVNIEQNHRFNPKGRFFCPFKVLRTYLNMRGGYDDINDQFFIFSDKSKVTSSQFRNTLKESIAAVGLNSTLFNTHSYHIGRPTDLFKAGCSIDEITHWEVEI